MTKKLVKKKKLKLLPCFIVLLLFGGLSFLVYFFLNLPIKNLIVKNTVYLNDDYVLELAGVKDYPSFWLLSTNEIEKKLETSPYILEADVERNFFHVLVISVTENKPLFINNTNHTVVFADKEEVKIDEEIDLFRVPRLINYVPDNKYKTFVKGMANIKKDILGKISDIEYQPNDYDKDRFLLYMDDGNMVYLTLTKFDMINYYNDVLSQLENKKGILYLDNGNHFQIME
ncbi:MAG: FtsQ-type POTRA domain-containing protein [bacterium]|nr:FtsQ-type POTRA domain-containing protein [Mycoplasmatota bacterium]MDD6756601.1 FtsQ-type POTRA domain-containing protein [bacterium]MDY2907965.1 FtsQ-type POTRA domain-containing protein [Candidatus Faecimonas sp.]